MKRWGTVTAILLGIGLCVSPARSEEEGTDLRVDASLPGQILSHVVATPAEGTKEIWFLLAPNVDDDDTGPEERSRFLARLEIRDGGTVSSLRDDLPHDSTSIAAVDLDGDGADEPVLVRESGIYEIDDPGLSPLIEEPDLRLVSGGRRPIALATTNRGARFHGPRAGDGAWHSLAEVDLPARGRLRGRTLTISRHVPTPFGSREDGSLLLATLPEAAGKHRVETTVVEVSPDGEFSVLESWSRLPAAEDVLDRRLLMIDGEPHLMLTTKPAGKLALFGEKRLRLYPVEHDRTRLGLSPRFAVDSHMNLWQEPVPVLLDVNGDGRNDLVLGYWKGIMTPRVVLDAYLREEDGSFSKSVRTTAFDVKKGDWSLLHYGDDLDGDGRADLLIRAGDGLRLHPGLPGKRGAKLVDRKHRMVRLTDGEDGTDDEIDDEIDEGLTMEIGTGEGFSVHEIGNWKRPRVADIDGDGRKEIYVVHPGSRAEPGFFRAVRLAPPS